MEIDEKAFQGIMFNEGHLSREVFRRVIEEYEAAKAEQPVDLSGEKSIKRFSQWMKENKETPYAAMTLAVHEYFHYCKEDVGFGDDPYHDNEAMKFAMAKTETKRESITLEQATKLFLEASGKWRNERDIVHDNPPMHRGEIESGVQSVLNWRRGSDD